MQIDLLVFLINNGIVQQGTEVTILRPSRGMGEQSTIYLPHNLELLDIKVLKDKVILKGVSTIDGKQFKIGAQHILKIDGMEPERLSTAFKTDGKKRGRKSKKR